MIVNVPGPAGAAPIRRPGSVRRTSTIEAFWPSGAAGTTMAGRCRDLYTPMDDTSPRVLADAEVRVRTTGDRTLEELYATPSPPDLDKLVGAPGGRGARRKLAETLPDERRAGTPLYLLLDDLPAVTLIANVAHVLTKRRRGEPERVVDPSRLARRAGICAGYRPGATALELDADNRARTVQDMREVAQSIVRDDDPWSWHQLVDPPGLSLRRARRIDVFVEGSELQVDAMFQDSCRLPDGSRFAVHEYLLRAVGDRAGTEVRSVVAEPRVLPYIECPLAADNVSRIVGGPFSDLRDRTLTMLPGSDGCTHLNDALRALAEVPILAAALGPGIA